MNKFKYAAIIAIVAISAVIGTMSMKKNSPKTELSGLALANVEALTESGETSKTPVYKSCKTGTIVNTGIWTDYCSSTYTNAGTNCSYRCFDPKTTSSCISYYK